MTFAQLWALVEGDDAPRHGVWMMMGTPASNGDRDEGSVADLADLKAMRP